MKIPFKAGEVVEVSIDRLAKGGFGVARFEGFVVFVPLAAPQDYLKVQISEVKKNFAYANIVEILIPSPSRVTPKCEVFGICGGCNWQHISYEEQLQQKQFIVQWSLQKLTKNIEPIVPAPDPWSYRRRVQLHFKENKIGFLRRGSHEIVEVKTCPIARGELVANWPQTWSQAWKSKAELRLLDDGIVEVQSFEDFPEFSQVNMEQNQTLQNIVIKHVRAALTNNSGAPVYDLYCGSGNFAFSLANAGVDAEVIGIDSDERLVAQAMTRAKQYPKLKFKCLRDTELGKLDLSQSIVVMDPPRAGAPARLLEKLSKQKPLAIVYVSCDTQTAARDFKTLSEDFDLEVVSPVDMFPQTDHIELVGLLR